MMAALTMYARTTQEVGPKGQHRPNSRVGVDPDGATAVPESHVDPTLGRVLQLLWDNDRLLDEVGHLVERVEEACCYLSDPECNADLGLELLVRLKASHRDAIARLRANRREVRLILDDPLSQEDGRRNRSSALHTNS